MKFLPDSLHWLQPVIIAAIVVFVVDLIGNIISFSSRITNALITAIIFALIFGALVKSNMGGVRMDLPTSAELGQKAKELQGKAMEKVDAVKDKVNEMRGGSPVQTVPAAPAAPKQ
jgi:hypothetical protein